MYKDRLNTLQKRAIHLDWLTRLHSTQLDTLKGKGSRLPFHRTMTQPEGWVKTLDSKTRRRKNITLEDEAISTTPSKWLQFP